MKDTKINELKKKKYLSNVKLLSKFKNEKSSAYVYLLATFISLTILVFSAIGPTIGTIVELQKKLEDSKNADSELDKKIQNMGSLRNQYNQLIPDLPLVMDALPEEPNSTNLLGRMQAVAGQSSVEIVLLTAKGVPIKSGTLTDAEVTGPNYNFSVSVKGNYANVMQFFKTVSTFARIVTIQSFSVSREDGSENESSSTSRILTLEGRAYFQK